MAPKKYIINQAAASEKIHRMTLQLAEQLSGMDKPVVIIGIKNNGLVLAEQVGKLLKNYISSSIQVIAITMDKKHPDQIQLSEEIDLNQKNVILVDDVTNSGKTLLYALKPLLNYYPNSLQTMVLVERMHKLFPISPDYVGLSLATTAEEHIQVEVLDDQVMGAYLV